MHKQSLCLIVFAQADEQIALTCSASARHHFCFHSLHPALPTRDYALNASYSALVAHFVKAFVSNDGLPLFYNSHGIYSF
jgi:hypothetical protein